MAVDPAVRRLALRTLLAAFAGKSAPEWASGLLTEGLAGHTLFGRNIAGPGQLARLSAELRAARPDALIAADEEGGDVTRLGRETGSPYPGNAALGAVDDPELTRSVYAAIGAELAAGGINLALAPTVDVNTTADNPVIGTRAFGAEPLLVARHAVAAVTGLQETGVAACAKHFPGHGATSADSHLELPTVDASLDLLRERDLPPFAAVIAAGAQAIMTAHIRVPALTGTGPATFSRAVLTDLLRHEYGFSGVIVTDALEMKGATAAAGSPGQAAVLALAAGADLLCLGARVDQALIESTVAEIAAAVTDGRLPIRRLEEAAERNAALAAWASRPASPRTHPADLSGAPATDDPAADSPVEGRGAAEGPAADRGAADGPAATGTAALSGQELGIGYAAARRAIRVEGSLVDITDPLVVQIESGPTQAEGRVPWGLKPHLSGVEQISVVAADASPGALAEHAGSRPIVLVGRRVHRTETTRALIEILAASHTVAVVEMGWPSSWRPRGARAFLTTYGASHANGRAAAEALGLTGRR
ncbi:MAG: glycoside hydrolase family 3 N-terminal domain-containing protein [Actinoplanes sp.]